jgi:hypothetical protein
MLIMVTPAVTRAIPIPYGRTGRSSPEKIRLPIEIAKMISPIPTNKPAMVFGSKRPRFKLSPNEDINPRSGILSMLPSLLKLHIFTEAVN